MNASIVCSNQDVFSHELFAVSMYVGHDMPYWSNVDRLAREMLATPIPGENVTSICAPIREHIRKIMMYMGHFEQIMAKHRDRQKMMSDQFDRVVERNRGLLMPKEIVTATDVLSYLV